MESRFYVKENRLDELKSFIKSELPTARFKHNPLKEGDKYYISLTMDVDDGNKLSQLQNKWNNEDKPPKSPKKINFCQKISNKISSLISKIF